MTSLKSGACPRPRVLDLLNHSERMLRVHRKNLVHACALKTQLEGLDGECERRVNRIRHEIYQLYFTEQLPREREILNNRLEQTRPKTRQQPETQLNGAKTTAFYQIFHEKSFNNNGGKKKNRQPSAEKEEVRDSSKNDDSPGKSAALKRINPQNLPALPSIVGPIQNKLETIRKDRERTLQQLRDAPPTAEEYLASLREKRQQEGPRRRKSVVRAEEIGLHLREAARTREPPLKQVIAATPGEQEAKHSSAEEETEQEGNVTHTDAAEDDFSRDSAGAEIKGGRIGGRGSGEGKEDGGRAGTGAGGAYVAGRGPGGEARGGRSGEGRGAKTGETERVTGEPAPIEHDPQYPESGRETARLLENLVKLPLTRKQSRTKEADSHSDPGRMRGSRKTSVEATPNLRDFLRSLRGDTVEGATEPETEITARDAAAPDESETVRKEEPEIDKPAVKPVRKTAKKRKKSLKFH